MTWLSDDALESELVRLHQSSQELHKALDVAMDQVDSNQSSIPTLLSDSPMSQEGGSSSDVENTDEFPVVSLEQAAQEAKGFKITMPHFHLPGRFHQ